MGKGAMNLQGWLWVMQWSFNQGPCKAAHATCPVESHPETLSPSQARSSVLHRCAMERGSPASANRHGSSQGRWSSHSLQMSSHIWVQPSEGLSNSC